MTMKIQMMDPAQLTPYESNPRDNDGAVGAVAESIQEFGFKNPIIVDKDLVIIAGHTRLKAALSLGLREVPVIVASDLTEEQARAYRLADNKTGELATWLEAMLTEELAQIEDIDMSKFGFDLQDFVDSLPEGMHMTDTSESESGSLAKNFIIPPFSVFDARQGYWIERTRMWKEKIKEWGQAREGAKAYTIAMSKNDNGVSILNPTLAEVVVTWFRPLNGDKCFDPFAGDTIFGFVSSYLGMKFTGIEIRPEQAEFNQARIDDYGLDATYICDDGQNVARHLPPASQDLLFSCPPYYDLEVYSDLPNDASAQPTYEAFLKILDNAFGGAVSCLKDNRFAVIVVGDVRDKKGAYRNFVDDVKRIFISKGMALYNEIILLTPLGTASLRSNNGMRNRKVTKVHQNVLVFYKGDLSKIQEHFGPVEVMEVESDDE